MGRSFLLTVELEEKAALGFVAERASSGWTARSTTAAMVAADVDDAEDVDAAEGDVVDGAVRAFFDTTTSRSAAT